MLLGEIDIEAHCRAVVLTGAWDIVVKPLKVGIGCRGNAASAVRRIANVGEQLPDHGVNGSRATRTVGPLGQLQQVYFAGLATHDVAKDALLRFRTEDSPLAGLLG